MFYSTKSYQKILRINDMSYFFPDTQMFFRLHRRNIKKKYFLFTAKAVVQFGSGEEISLESNIPAAICLVKESTNFYFHDTTEQSKRLFPPNQTHFQVTLKL